LSADSKGCPMKLDSLLVIEGVSSRVTNPPNLSHYPL
jgi:hypothetical protein